MTHFVQEILLAQVHWLTPAVAPLVTVDSDMMELIQLLFLKLLGYSDIVKEFMDMRRLSKSFSLGSNEFRASFTDLLSLVCTEGR